MNPLSLKPVSFEHRLKQLGTLLLIAAFCGYATYQARDLIVGPTIALHGDLPVIQSARAIELTGNAQNVVVLRINGKEIHTNESGAFTHTLVLESGYTIMKLEAEDRYGRSTSLTRTFMYSPQT